MSQRELLARLLSIVTNKTIYPSRDKVPRGIQADDLTLDFYANVMYDKGQIGHVENVGPITVHVKLITGKIVDVHCQNDEYIFLFKMKLQKAANLPIERQHLMYNNRILKEGRISDFGIGDKTIIHNVLIMKSNEQKNYYLEGILDPSHNYDYRRPNDGKVVSTGGYVYDRPFGSYRNALMVTRRFDNGNDRWLDSGNGNGIWPISYNGTHCHKFPEIKQWGEKLNVQSVEGSAVFCTDSYKLALQHSDVLTDPLDGKKYKILLQHRVNPNKIRKATEVGGPEHFWYIPSQRDIRAYQICVFEM